jgi:hypothetical protein
MWFNPPAKGDAPIHAPGTAMDLHFVGNANSEGYVLQLLQDLPAIGTLTVFRDTDSTLHLDRRDGGYGLGIPAKGDFLRADMAIDESGRCPGQRAAEQAAGADHSRTLEAKGIEKFGGTVKRSTATWSNGTWQWSKWTPTNESLVDHIRSAKVRAAITNFGRKQP